MEGILGSDSDGRLYWVLANLGRHPWVMVNFRVTMQQGDEMTFGPGASYPYLDELNDANALCSPWVSFQSDADIKELVECLRENDPKERELNKSILHWQSLRFQDSKQTENRGQGGPEMGLSGSTNSENSVYSKSLITKAACLLENKYGPWSELETIDSLKKRGRKPKVITEEKMFRCSCLEPVWLSRCHCLSCHRSFLTEVKLQGHNDAKCKAGLPASDKSKGNGALNGKGIMKPETLWEECAGETDIIEISKSDRYELNSKLIKYQNDGLLCPCDFEEICSKLVTKNSMKELVQEIGLIGSNGIPIFVPSVSPYLSDPTLMLVPPKRDVCVPSEEPKTDEQLVFTKEIRVTTNVGDDSISNNFARRFVANELNRAFKSDNTVFGSLGQKDENLSFHRHAPALEVGNCCVILKYALRPLVGKAARILRRLKINLLDMEAALPETALRPSKVQLARTWAWHAFVKSADTIYEMVQDVIVFKDMIKTKYLRNMSWYWSLLSAAAKISTLSALALRIYSLDAAIDYEKNSSNLDQLELSSKPDQKPQSGSDATEKLSKD